MSVCECVDSKPAFGHRARRTSADFDADGVYAGRPGGLVVILVLLLVVLVLELESRRGEIF